MLTVQTVSNPLKEGHHFDQDLGGVVGMFENLRTNTRVCISIMSYLYHN
jgi:hypothetical protein